jgi:16S rRNA (guanine527-N7)-methyltransferase
MDPARIAKLLEPYLAPASDQRLTTNDLRGISIYIDLLQRWNARINLTAIRNEEEIVTRHFGESLFAARHLFPLRSSTVKAVEVTSNCSGEQAAAEQRKRIKLADVGSGPGFPGIPIKLWETEIALTLIESNHKKATFLREVARCLTLTDINIQNARAETLPSHTFDVVTLRAVERFETALPITERLLAPNGRLALLIGTPQLPAAAKLLPTLTWSDPLPIPLSESRVLSIGHTR